MQGEMEGVKLTRMGKKEDWGGVVPGDKVQKVGDLIYRKTASSNLWQLP